MQSTGARSQYHAGIVQVRKRADRPVGRQLQLHLQPPERQPVRRRATTTSSAPGLQNNYTVIPDSPYYNPDQEYGRSLLDSPHKIVLAPTFNLPFGEGKTLASGWPTRCSAAGRSRR